MSEGGDTGSRLREQCWLSPMAGSLAIAGLILFLTNAKRALMIFREHQRHFLVIAVAVIVTLMWASAAVAICGDEVIEQGEDCDDGLANGTLDSCCTVLCAFKGLIEPCTDPNPGNCNRATCTNGVCTDGFALAPGTPCTPTSPLGECVDALCDEQGNCGVNKSPITPCTDPNPGNCFRATCTNGVCTDGFNMDAGAPCEDTTPGDCFVAECDEQQECIQTASVLAAGSECADAVPGDCMMAQCNASQQCIQMAAAQADGTACTDTLETDCFFARCDAGACDQSAAALPLGSACGDQAVSECDLADTCDAVGACLSNFVAEESACTDTNPFDCPRAACDGRGVCDQLAVPCPAPVASSYGLTAVIASLCLVAFVGLLRRFA